MASQLRCTSKSVDRLRNEMNGIESNCLIEWRMIYYAGISDNFIAVTRKNIFQNMFAADCSGSLSITHWNIFSNVYVYLMVLTHHNSQYVKLTFRFKLHMFINSINAEVHRQPPSVEPFTNKMRASKMFQRSTTEAFNMYEGWKNTEWKQQLHNTLVFSVSNLMTIRQFII